MSGRLPELMREFPEADMSEVKKVVNQTNSKQESGLGILLRLFWMMAGNLLAFITLIGIFQSESSTLDAKDLIYWALIILLVITRYIDIKFLGGLTASGYPASISAWYRYASVLFIVAGLLWGLARFSKLLLF